MPLIPPMDAQLRVVGYVSFYLQINKVQYWESHEYFLFFFTITFI